MKNWINSYLSAQKEALDSIPVEEVASLIELLKKALADKTVSVIDCPVDYSENMKLTNKLGEMVCPI